MSARKSKPSNQSKRDRFLAPGNPISAATRTLWTPTASDEAQEAAARMLAAAAKRRSR